MDKILKRESKQKLKVNVFLLIGAILIFLLFFEIFLRIFGYPNYGFQEGCFQQDEIIGYRLSPNYSGLHSIYQKTVKIETNSEGLRDFREYAYNQSDKLRILILGDSTSFGNGVELKNSYPELLRQKFGEEVEIINSGTPGYGINNQYLYFMNEGIKYNPDIILLQATLNDWGTHKIIDKDGKEIIDSSNSLSVNRDGVLVNKNSENLLRSIHLFFLMKSRSYSFLYSKSRDFLSFFVDNYGKKNIPLIYMLEDSKEYREAYDGYSNLLWKLNYNTDAKIIVFMGPHRLYLSDSNEIQEKYNLNYSVNPLQVKESIKKISESFNIDFIEVESNDPSIFLKVDGHWTPRGNQIIADELYIKIKKNLENDN